MPAKKLITKEMIVEAACNVVREVGFQNLNVRALAKKLNCSTQPVYLSFSNFDEVKSDVLNKAKQTFEQFVKNEIESKRYPPFKAVGMAYIRFAKEEREFFKAIYMDGSGADGWTLGEHSKSANVAKKSYSLTDNEADKIQDVMWVFVHGIATACATGFYNWDWQDIDRMVTDVYISYYKNLKEQKNDG